MISGFDFHAGVGLTVVVVVGAIGAIVDFLVLIPVMVALWIQAVHQHPLFALLIAGAVVHFPVLIPATSAVLFDTFVSVARAFGSGHNSCVPVGIDALSNRLGNTVAGGGKIR